MAVKSVIDIDVNDDAFKAFIDMFNKYKVALDKMPAAWGATEKAVDRTADGMSDMVTAIGAQTAMLTKAITGQQKMRGEVDRTNRSMQNLGRSVGRVAGGIKDITMSMLKWGSITSAFSLLTGATGLFGYTAMAQSAANTRRTSMGLGVSPNQLQAANITYGQRISNVGGLMERIADIQSRSGEHYLLEQLGISREDISGKTAAELLPRTLSGAGAMYRQFAPGQEAYQAEARGLTGMLSVADLRTAAGMRTEEHTRLRTEFEQRSRSLGASNVTNERYQTFLSRLETAGTALQNTLIDKLVKLSGPINSVIDAFTRLVKEAIGTPEFETGIKNFAKYIDELAKSLGSPEARQGIRDFATNVGEVVRGLGRFAEWLASWFPERKATSEFMQSGAYPNYWAQQDTRLFRPEVWGQAASEVGRAAGQYFTVQPGQGPVGNPNALGGRANPAGGFYGNDGDANALRERNARYAAERQRLMSTLSGAALATALAELSARQAREGSGLPAGVPYRSPTSASEGGAWDAGLPGATGAVRPMSFNGLRQYNDQWREAFAGNGSPTMGSTAVVAQPGQGVRITVLNATGGNLVNTSTALGSLAV